MSTPITILYYVLLFVHVASVIGALAIALKSLLKGGPANGLWHAAVTALVAGLGLTAVLSMHDGVNEVKIGVKLAVSVAVLALSLLVARREKDISDAALLADAGAAPAEPAPVALDDTSSLEIAADDDDEIPAKLESPEGMRRRLLSGVVIGLVVNVLLALLW